MDYCEKHHRHFDTDFELDGCIRCLDETLAFLDSREEWIDKRIGDRIDGYDRDDLGESPDF
jgi:hypothetical protein